MGGQVEETIEVNKKEKVATEPEEITELPAEVHNQALKEIVESHFGTSIADCTISFDSASGKGDNYVGILYRVTAKYPNRDDLKVIVKLPPQSLARREQFSARQCFLRESQFYDTIHGQFTKFQVDKGISVERERFYEVPNCYKSFTEEPLEGLFLEDVKVAGFEMFDRFKDVTAEHVKLVMKILGKFHAISIAMKDQTPELLEPYRGMKDIFFEDENIKESSIIWFDMLKKQAGEVLDTCANEDLVQKGRKILETDFSELLNSCIQGELAEPHAVLNHGDCWNNNIMYRSENGVPVEAVLLDWQIMRYASPVCDLLYYIFCCTTKNLRDKHYEDFMDIYYESLSDHLKRLGSDPSIVFPREVLEDHLKRFGKFGLAMAIMVLPIFTSNAEDVPDMDEMAEKFKTMQENGENFDEKDLQFTSSNTVDVYNERMLGVFEDMVELGYI